MTLRSLATATAFLVLGALQATAQPTAKPTDPPRTAATFDAAAIRRRAAQMTEFQALLADPDPMVRLLTLREAIRAGDELQRRTAIDSGLASNEASMLEQALRGVLSNTHQIIFEFVDTDGKPTTKGNLATLTMSLTKFDSETGQMEGMGFCGRQWSGQLQGIVMNFGEVQNVCSGSLAWVVEAGDFRGHLNLTYGELAGNRSAVWKPR